MSETDNIYDCIQELLGDVKNSVSILEDQIDNTVQTEYFNFERENINEVNSKKIFNNREFIFSPDCSIEEKKYLLCNMAGIDHIEVYRTIEKYTRDPKNPIMDWARLALKENRLLLQSKLLDESQVLISTGLGGKGLNLRYFIVFFTISGKPFTRFEREIIKKEINYALKDTGGETESLKFNKELCLVLACIPIHISINILINSIIHECNQISKFLHVKYIVTNVRKYKHTEIRNFLQQNGIPTTGNSLHVSRHFR